jgi:hypothetical protein
MIKISILTFVLLLISSVSHAQAISCLDNSDCLSNYFCDKAIGDCARAGRCVLKPAACTTDYAPVCGCDGKTYSNECTASSNGVSIAYEGECDADADGIPDSVDNCPSKPNGYELGSCSPWSGSPSAVCESDNDCTATCTGVRACNKNQEDTDHDGVGDVCDNSPNNRNPLQKDADGDGVSDDIDQCPESALRPTITIDECYTGVANEISDEGCTMQDLINGCIHNVHNKGAVVMCVAHLTNVWKMKGLITGNEKGEIQRCAAKNKRKVSKS